MSSSFTLLRPELMWLALVIVPLLALGVLRLAGLSLWRRTTALFLQGLTALLLLFALAGPVLTHPNENLSLVVVLDTSASVSAQGRQEEAAYVKGLLAQAAPSDDIHFVRAAGQATVLDEADVASGGVLTATGGLSAQATDLAGGLRLAGTLLGDSGRRRVVLLTDGWETAGQAAQEAEYLTSRGVALDVVPLTALGSPEVIARGLSTPAYVRVGDSVQSDVTVYSTVATGASLRISVDGALLADRTVMLKPGDNRLPLDQKVQTEGYHGISVQVDSVADTSKANNTLSVGVVVKPQPKVLVLEDRPGEAAQVVAALQSRQVTVELNNPSMVPSQASGLEGYDAIVLNNVAATSLTLDQQRTLQEYVRSSGKGLVVIGGTTSYALGGYKDSALEEALPVLSQPAPRPEQGKIALVLVIDRSASMDEYRGQNKGPSKFDMAKEAARLAIDSVRQGDTLGVLTFDTENLWAYQTQVLGGETDKDQAKSEVSNIELGGGTSIYPALDEAANAIRRSDAPTKHIVLLTDGREYNTPDYTALISQMRADSITLSTVGIGSDADRDLLTRLAKMGQGRYYFTEQAEQIPKIVFKELDMALKEAKIEGSVQPRVAMPSPLLRGFAPQDLPQLGGYDVTVPRSDAVVGLTTDLGHPLLAHWQYGLGRVVAFTSDAGPKWASRWLSWDEFATFWSQAVRWTMASPVNRQLQPSVDVVDGATAARDPVPAATPPGNPAQAGQVAHLVVESLNLDNSFADLADVTAAVRSPSGVVTSTLMVQTAPGRYEADVPVGETGAYEARFTRSGDSGTGVTVTESAGFSVPSGSEFQNAGTNDRLLKQLTGGKDYIQRPDQALDITGLPQEKGDAEPVWPYFVAPALVLLLLSVAVRRLAFRLKPRAESQA